MRVHVCAVGRLRTGPERALIDDYTTRFDRTGRGLGLGPLTVTEVEDRKGGGTKRAFVLTASPMQRAPAPTPQWTPSPAPTPLHVLGGKANQKALRGGRGSTVLCMQASRWVNGQSMVNHASG